jgi:integrase/recombinase XerD
MRTDTDLWLERDGEYWTLSGPGSPSFSVVNEYLSYLADRNYSPRTVRAYGFDLLNFARWLLASNLTVAMITTDVLLQYLAACRQAQIPGRPGPNVVSLQGQRLDRYAATTINRRMAAISSLFIFLTMRDPDLKNPVPKRRITAAERTGLLGHLARPKPRSALRLREPRRLPRSLSREETTNLLNSLRTWRDRAIAGLMLFCGLRSCEVLALQIKDVDIGARWLLVSGKGSKERRVPLDRDVAGVIQTYLLAERPETSSHTLFVVAKGPTRGAPLTAAGLRTIFRYHRVQSGVVAGNAHALRHTFGTALAEAGVDLAVMQALLGHTHVDTTARYIHLAPAHVKAEYDAARTRQRTTR